jgi:hypothetical protein
MMTQRRKLIGISLVMTLLTHFTHILVMTPNFGEKFEPPVSMEEVEGLSHANKVALYRSRAVKITLPEFVMGQFSTPHSRWRTLRSYTINFALFLLATLWTTKCLNTRKDKMIANKQMHPTN